MYTHGKANLQAQDKKRKKRLSIVRIVDVDTSIPFLILGGEKEVFFFVFFRWVERKERGKKNGNLHDVEATVVKRLISNKRPLHGNELHAVVHAIMQAKHYDEHDVRGHVGILDTGNGRRVLCDSVSNGDSSRKDVRLSADSQQLRRV